jgi:hypothetical protein
MTSPAESNQGRFYSERVGDKAAEYAWKQRIDIIDGLAETNRLARALWDSILGQAPAPQLVAESVELWSAVMHYSSAFVTNIGAGIAGMGYEIRKGKTDDSHPHRIIDFGRVLAGSPTPTRFWMVGVDPKAPMYLPIKYVFLLQSFANQGTSKWDVIFDLSGPIQDPMTTWTGTYCLELNVGDRRSDTHYEYFYLDPQPTR